MQKERKNPECCSSGYEFPLLSDNKERIKMASVKELLKLGLIQVGDELVWKRKLQGVTHTAVVDGDGMIKTSDGRLHKTPSGAAKHLNGNKPVDGWLAWKMLQSNVSLSELREKIK
jgi:hypothetical protein